ncbi:phosphotransferase family protein [Kyrpidia tusciae]|uniref:Aminoglycoside phosphotransferase n=1 Tax=Kyrpidia tusciae (strain DSM 2912 / NBRC 15312 / T2) TaxID=562970 RepID=D5WXI4_KYRT2|nr:phosphotransferase family protein [Kyrpidia tusciae]ADG05905.1 aminoglycoside phosphotransferase [Kyrpidia tusciae DSM 2912]
MTAEASRPGRGRGTIPVRPGEELDVDAVRRFLSGHIEGLGDCPVEVEQFPSGASNLTYWIRCGAWEAVLRRPPFGPLPPKAHDMKRESSFLSRLHRVFPLAPRPYAFCEDPEVLGAPFYVMEYRRGAVLDDKFPPGVEATPELCRRISYAVVDTLAELHAVDYREAGLGEFGRPEGFLQRQVGGWIDRYHRAKTDDIPQVDRITRWLGDHLPASPAATIIHNDYKLNNLLLDPGDLSRIVAVVDWEMATIGDPLFDLAVSLSYWAEETDPELLKEVLPTVTKYGGFLSRDEFVERYWRRSGRDVSSLDFYMVFAYFKLAVILQQIYVRWKRGQTQDPRFAGFGLRVRRLLEYADGCIPGRA